MSGLMDISELKQSWIWKNFAGDLQAPGKQLFMRKDFKFAALIEFSKYHNYPIILQDILKGGMYIKTNFSIYIHI